MRDALGPLFTDTDFTSGRFAGMYSPLGQPGLSPALLAMVTILQFRHNLSDADAAQAVADRISWKYALGLDLDDAGFDPSVLTEFRARLVVDERANALLELMLDRLKAAGLVRAGGRQRTDSTHVIAGVRRLNRIETVGETLRAALETIAGISPGWIAAAAGGRMGRTVRPQGRDQPAAAPQERLRAGPGRPDRRRRSQTPLGDRRRPGRGLDERTARGGDPAAGLAAAVRHHQYRPAAAEDHPGTVPSGRAGAFPVRPRGPLQQQTPQRTAARAADGVGRVEGSPDRVLRPRPAQPGHRRAHHASHRTRRDRHHRHPGQAHRPRPNPGRASHGRRLPQRRHHHRQRATGHHPARPDRRADRPQRRQGHLHPRRLHHQLGRGRGDLPRRGHQPINETRQARPGHLRILPP
ncbi:transposase [Dactylosporangium roseum]|uniref:Transposase n=1 Tax=Dactylosporangium roseum TaxID=47989 RepID=A0ABY5Z5T0_9ACTN|nr:transposase [Dactylosporangium roseum]